MARHERVTIDVGTGDGRAVFEAAARHPTHLILGLDAAAAAMAEASRRASRNPRKGGLPNAAFVVAAAETPPIELCSIASVVTVRFPWASLLRGCLGLDERVAAGVAGLVAPGGRLELLLAPSPRDGLEGIPTEVDQVVAAAAQAFSGLGLDLAVGREASEEEVDASGSSWARRLRAGRKPGARRANGEDHRAATIVRFVRPAGR